MEEPNIVQETPAPPDMAAAPEETPVEQAAPESPEFEWSHFDWGQFRDWRWIAGGALGLALLIYAVVPGSGSSQRPTASAPAPAAPAQAPATLPSLMELSLQYYQAKRYDEAIVLSKAMIERDPKMAEAYNNLGVSYAGLSEWEKAKASLEKAVSLRPDFQLAKNNLAWIETEIEKTKKGEEPPEVYLNRSLAEYHERKFDQCIADAKQALKIKPDFPEAYNNIAAASMELHKYDDAIAASQAALRIKPDFALAKGNLDWATAEKQKATRKGSGKP